jgi:hypothetical protein
VLVVPNKDTLKKIPPAQGLLAFRQKNQQLLVQGQQGWNTIAMAKKVNYLINHYSIFSKHILQECLHFYRINF